MAVRPPPESLSQSTRILSVDPSKLGEFNFSHDPVSELDNWQLRLGDGADSRHLCEAADNLRGTDIPVAFPTETVYGLGADATRSSAVQGIYKAKQRPSDNPLIVHICSLDQLRNLLEPSEARSDCGLQRRHGDGSEARETSIQTSDTSDQIPTIYKPLIQRFWPGPLTILLPNPKTSQLAPEVTAGLPTFGVRMPRSLLALALIKLADVPLAAPSANASTKPSPTTADHVLHDLDGRISIILDGGPCDVGVESTVVDGLSNPPCILRPGGISIEQLREYPGWEDVVVAYKDGSEKGSKPRAPGMKYRHYSPKATVVLHEAGSIPPSIDDLRERLGASRSIGVIKTETWEQGLTLSNSDSHTPNVSAPQQTNNSQENGTYPSPPSSIHSIHPPPSLPHHGFHPLLRTLETHQTPSPHHHTLTPNPTEASIDLWQISLGPNPESIARNLFSALRSLDQKGVDTIFVEGIRDEGDVAAAVMNRLRKAAEVKVS